MNNKQKYEENLIRNGNIEDYGIYLAGLTSKEIMTYLRAKSKGTKYAKLSTEKLCNKFDKIAGRNTMALIELENGENISLMYRWDVERFANNLFKNKPLIWD